jgi:hypothetical protein
MDERVKAFSLYLREQGEFTDEVWEQALRGLMFACGIEPEHFARIFEAVPKPSLKAVKEELERYVHRPTEPAIPLVGASASTDVVFTITFGDTVGNF